MDNTENTNADKGQGTNTNTNAARNKGGRPRNSCGQGWNGDALKLRRMARGLSATAFGRAVQASQSTVLRWERGDHPTEVQLLRIAEALGCEPRSLSRAPEIH